MNDEVRTTLAQVLTSLRELLLKISAGEIEANDEQHVYLRRALEAAEQLGIEDIRLNGRWPLAVHLGRARVSDPP